MQAHDNTPSVSDIMMPMQRQQMTHENDLGNRHVCNRTFVHSKLRQRKRFYLSIHYKRAI